MKNIVYFILFISLGIKAQEKDSIYKVLRASFKDNNELIVKNQKLNLTDVWFTKKDKRGTRRYTYGNKAYGIDTTFVEYRWNSKGNVVYYNFNIILDDTLIERDPVEYKYENDSLWTEKTEYNFGEKEVTTAVHKYLEDKIVSEMFKKEKLIRRETRFFKDNFVIKEINETFVGNMRDNIKNTLYDYDSINNTINKNEITINYFSNLKEKKEMFFSYDINRNITSESVKISYNDSIISTKEIFYSYDYYDNITEMSIYKKEPNQKYCGKICIYYSNNNSIEKIECYTDNNVLFLFFKYKRLAKNNYLKFIYENKNVEDILFSMSSYNVIKHLYYMDD